MKINIDEIVELLDDNNDIDIETLTNCLLKKTTKPAIDEANSNFIYLTMDELGISRNNKKVYDMLMSETDFDMIDENCGDCDSDEELEEEFDEFDTVRLLILKELL